MPQSVVSLFAPFHPARFVGFHPKTLFVGRTRNEIRVAHVQGLEHMLGAIVAQGLSRYLLNDML